MQKNRNGRTAFHWVCNNNHLSIVETIVKKSVHFNIDLNSKDENGMTGFHLACMEECMEDHVKIVEILVQKSVEFDIDLNAKDEG